MLNKSLNSFSNRDNIYLFSGSADGIIYSINEIWS